MAITIQNPNNAEYWNEVKRRAALRKAMIIVRNEIQNMRKSSVYEQYIFDCINIVNSAAQCSGLSDEAANYQTFKAACAKDLGLPELIELEEHEIARYSSEAIAKATSVMDGSY